MRKFFLSLNLLILSVVFCYAENSYYVGDDVSDLHVLNDYHDGAYVLFVRDGRLKIMSYHENSGYIDLTDTYFGEIEYTGINSLCVSESQGKPFFVFMTYIQEKRTYQLLYSWLNDKCVKVTDFDFNKPLYNEKLFNIDSNNCYFINNGNLYCFSFEDENLITLSENKNITKYEVVENKTISCGYFFEDNYCYLFTKNNANYVNYNELGIVDKDVKLSFINERDTSYLIVHYQSHSLVYKFLENEIKKIADENTYNYYRAEDIGIKKILSLVDGVVYSSDNTSTILYGVEDLIPIYLSENENILLYKANHCWGFYTTKDEENKNYDLSIGDEYSIKEMSPCGKYFCIVFYSEKLIKCYLINSNADVLNFDIKNDSYNDIKVVNNNLLLSNDKEICSVRFKDSKTEKYSEKKVYFSSVNNGRYLECILDKKNNILINEVTNEL